MTIPGLTIAVLVAFGVSTSHAASEVSKLEPQAGGKGGGIRITVYGAGFSSDQFNFGVGNEAKGNEVKLVKTDDPSVTNDCEIHKDGSTESQIMCFVPPGMDDGTYMVKAKVDGERVTDCTASKCLYTVNDQYTPYIDSIVPQSGKPGEVILTLHGRIFTIRLGSNTLDSPNGISQKLLRAYAPQTCNLFEAQDVFYKFELDSPDSYYGTIQCKPEGTFVGNSNPSFLLEPPYGRSLVDSSLHRISSDGSVYTFQYYTDVQSISPQTGSNLGNLRVTVTGDYYETSGNQSTYKPAEVFIGGQNCPIVYVEKNKEIVCIVPAKKDNPYPFYPGNRGVLLESWSDAFESYDAVFSRTDAPESIDWIDETLYCGNMTNKLTRMTGVLTVPFDGNYQFLIKADEGGKFIVEIDSTPVGIESTGDWQATGLKPLIKGQLVKIVMVGKPGTNADSCVEMKLHHLDTTVTETKKSKSEMQTIQLTSEIKYQNYTLKFSNFASSTPTNEKQTLCLTGSSSTYQLKLYNVSTSAVDVSVASNAKEVLDKLPFLTEEESFSVEKNAANEACINITFSSKRGDIPLIETVPDTGVTVTTEVQGSSNNLDFAFIFNGVPSPLITYDASNKTAFAKKIEDALYGMFSVQCPSILTTGGQYQVSFEPNTHSLGSQVTSEVVPFCGRNSCKNCYRLFPITEANNAKRLALLYQWLCFAVGGHDRNLVFLKFEDRNGDRKQKWITIEDSNIFGDGYWTYKCVNIKEQFNKAWPTVSTVFQLIEARLPYNEEDFYVDEIFIGKTKPTGTLDSLKGMRLGPASPNLNMYEAVDWVTVAYDETNDEYQASIAPFGCLHDFDLLTLAGSTTSGDSSSSSNSVTSTLTTGASPAGTLITTVTSKASKPLQGTVTLNYDGKPSTVIDVEKEDQVFKEALETIDGIGTINVQRTSTSTCANMDINVEFISVPGDRSLLTVTSDFTSGNGGTADVVPKRDGYLEISPITGDMLSTIHDNPQVSVKINGVPTKCAMANHECSFTYSTDSTPTITGTDISEGNQNDVLTIMGTMFSATPSENTVKIDGVQCDVTSSDVTQIVCTLGNGRLGQYPVEVTVEGKGMASGNILFNYTASLDSISPQASTLGGNVVLTVSGKGLSDDTVVLFEAEECVKTGSEIPTKIYCTVPPYTDLTVTSGQTVTVTVKSDDVVISTESFDYNYIMAQITSVTPSGVLTVHGGQTITIEGTSLGVNGKVYLGQNELIVDSRSDTMIVAVTPEPTVPGTALELIVLYGTEGAVLKGSAIPTLDVELSVSLVYPKKVSLNGGTPLTIIGTGFGDLETHVKVTVGDNDCEVTDVTNTKINCILASTATVHKVNNLDTTGYGPFNPSRLTVQQGDFIEWSWTSSEFHELSVSIAETETMSSLENKPDGISSGQTSSEGSFMERMVNEGQTYFWTGFVDSDNLYYRMIVEVNPREATKEAVTVLVNGIEAHYNLNSGQSDPQDASGCAIASSDIDSCTPEEVAESDETKFNIFFTKCRSPAVDSISFPKAVSTIDRSALPTTELAISGTGFGTSSCANEVKIGDCPCTVSDSTVNSFKCILATDCQPEVGKYLEFSLMVNQYGNALVNIQNRLDRSVIFVPTISSLSPISGSSQGGTIVTVTGTGFTDDLDLLVVNFGDYAAECNKASQTSLTCTTPYSSVPGSVTVAVKSDGVQALCESDCNFKYDTTITPQVTSVSPNQVSDTTTLTIAGEKFGSDPAKLTIKIGGETCSGITVETNDVSVSCSVEAIPAGENKIEMMVDGVGKALCADGVSVTGEALATVNPASGSIHGGTVLTFSGHGFVEGLSVQVDDTDICEEIMVKSLKEVECVTVAHDALAVAVEITSNGVTYDSVNFEFSEDASPNVVSVDPSTAAVGDTVSIECERCGVEASDIEVSIGGAECTGVTVSGSVISCTTGSQSSGDHDVIVHVSGKGRSQPGVTLTYKVTVLSINPLNVDEKGNQMLTVSGSGLSDTVSVTVCDKECTFASLPSSSEYKCITPPGTGSCDVKVTEGGITVTATQQLMYQADLAPFIEAITPSRGGTGGNTQITISGSRFSDTMSEVTVTIDGVPCVVSSSNTAEIECNTGAHSGTKVSEVVVMVNGERGTASDIKVLTFYYVDVWSSNYTWGGLAPPGEGEFVVIQQDQTVLLDTDTEVLEMIVIMGELIFDEVNLTLRAKRILITSGGNLQIGSEDRRFPASLKAIIELYGGHKEKELPIYGTKFIAVRNGTLNIFGAEIENTWTRLAETADAGATSITVQDTISDWKVGDEIFITTTGSKDSTNENEKRTITQLTDKTIVFDEPLEYQHLGEKEQFSGAFDETVDFEFSAEVGLLTRNVVVRGASQEDWIRDIVACEKGFNSGEFVTQTCFEGRFGEEKGSSQFGGQIILHAPEKDTQVVVGRISYLEVTFAGQAFRLGRYPIHFHLNGDMSQSYVRGCAIHETFNRAINVHGSHNILIEHNVAYNIMGGAFFLEDGIETGNTFQYNLVVFVRASSSLLNDDITPASYWVTNPNNTYISNTAAGGTHFGFWYRMHLNPDGPSFTKLVCPQRIPILKFQYNVAHSFGWFGLWIFQEYYPGLDGACNPTSAAPAYIENFTAWNNEKGAEFVNYGSVIVTGARFIQNVLAGFEGKRSLNAPVGGPSPTVNDTLIVGQASNTVNQNSKGVTKAGFILPYGDPMEAHNIKFINFDDSAAACMYTKIDGTCTELCGGYTNKLSRMKFDNVQYRLKYRWMHEGVIKDIDGSLSGTNTPTKLLPTDGHPPSGCTISSSYVSPDGLSAAECPFDMKFHRFAFNNLYPSSLAGKTFIATDSNNRNSSSEYRSHRVSHPDGHTVVLVGGLVYDFNFEGAEDITNVSFTGVFGNFDEDACLVFRLKLAQMPDIVSIDGGNNKPSALDGSVTCATSGLNSGDWSYENGYLSVAIVGNSSGADPSEHNVHFTALRCPFPKCELLSDPETTLPPDGRADPFQLWQDLVWEYDAEVDQWKASKYDKSGESPPSEEGVDVLIERDLWVLVNSENYAHLKLGTLIIKGTLEFAYEVDLAYTLEADFIIILGGFLYAGWKDDPMIGTMSIVLTGNANTPPYTELDGYDIGSKAMGVFGGLELHGRDVGSTWTRLQTTVSAGEKVLTVDNASKISEWRAGYKVFVTSSSRNMAEAEEAEIETIDFNAGKITLKENLKYRHTGGSETVNGYEINLSAVVGLLTRTVSIEGEYAEGEAYGGRILVSVSLDGEDVRTGYARLSHVLFEHMGQDGFTEFADPRFALAFLETGQVTDIKPSEVTGCAFVDTFNTAVGVIGLADMQLRDNVVLRPLGNAIVTASDNTVIDGNLVSSLLFTGVFEDRFEVENFRFEAGIQAIRATGLTLKNNYVAGSQRLGYHIAGEDCSLETSGYLNNVAVGNLYGAAVMPHDDLSAAGITSCSRLSGFTTFKNYDYGIYYNNKMSLVATENYLVDEQVYFFPMVVFPDPLDHECGGKTVEISDSILIGTSSVTNCDAEEEASGDYIEQNAKNIRSLRQPEAHRRGLLHPSFTGGINNCGEKPCWGIMSYNAICGKTTVKGVTFKSFNGAKSGCKPAYALSTMYGNDDLAHPIHLRDVSLIDVDEEFIYWIDRPNLSKVNPADCVDMDCDGMKKSIIKDLDGSLMGTPGTFVPDSAYEWNGDPRRGLNDNRIPNDMYANPDGSKKTIDELAPKGKGVVRTSACVKKSIGQGMSAYYWCPHAEIEMLLIESLDADTEFRRLSPVGVSQDGYIDLINGPQDHGWCFGYTCQKRISTFHALVLSGISKENIVQIYFSSTQPDKMRFALLDAIGKCVVIGVYYLNPSRMDLYVNNKYKLPKNGKYNANNDFVFKNEDGVDYTPTCDEENGANYIDLDTNIVYFTVRGGTEIDNAVQLKRADVILVSFGFPALKEEDFFNDDTIIKNLANLLGISLDKVRVVKVIAASSRRRRRSTDTGITVQLEIGDSPTPNFNEDSSSFTDVASDLMNQCQEGTVSSSLGVSDASCDQLVYGQTTYEPVPPEELWFYESVTPEHEGVPFSVQPKIRAYDENGDIVEHLGIEENPWEITASLRSCDPACGHANAVLTGTLTVSSSNGWFNFTDLQVSHKGDNYIIDFEVTSPSGTNLTLASEPFAVKALPMTAGVYSMTSGDVLQDSTFTITLDLRDESTDIPIPDITWRDHTSFDATCDIVAYSKTGNLSGFLSQTFDTSSGRATFNDLSFSGFGLIQIACITVSTPAEYEFTSIHKVYFIGTNQVNIPKDVSKRVEVKYSLDFDKVLPTKVAEAQLEQATVEAVATKWPNTLIRQSSIAKGSIIVSFTIEGDSSNVSMATEEICEELSSGMTVTVGSTTLTLDGYMLVDGSDYYSSCGKSDKSDGLHPAYIALIVIACLLVIGIIIFLLVWKFKIRPKSKTHGMKGDDSNTTNRYPGGFYYIDNGRTVFLAAPNKKMKEGMSGNVEPQAAGLAPLTTLYDETYGVFSIRKSPLPPGQEAVPRGLTPTGM